jgi:hypothetical protein
LHHRALLRYIIAPMIEGFVLSLWLIAATAAFGGGQHVIPDYAAAQRDWFWTKLYVNGGREFSAMCDLLKVNE